MFSRRSAFAQELPVIEARAGASDICVLNGDIFDFKWSTLPSFIQTVYAAADWLEGLVTKHPSTDFYFICGNHDSLPAFRAKLAEISSRHPNFTWCPYFRRIGPHLFLHGDIVDSVKHGISLDEYRKKFHTEGQKGLLMNLLYDLIIASQFHKIIFFVHKAPRIAPLILDYLRNEDQEVLEGVHNVFFGHTHVPFRDFMHEGIAFHNSGSMIRDLQCTIFEFEVEDYIRISAS